MLRISILALASAALASKKALLSVAPPNTAAPRCWYSVADKNTYVQYMNAKHKSWHCQSTCSKPANGHTLVDSDCSCTCLNHAPHGACCAITHYHAGGQRVRNVAGGASCFEGCAAGMPLGLERSQDTRQCPVVGVQGGLTELYEIGTAKANCATGWEPCTPAHLRARRDAGTFNPADASGDSWVKYTDPGTAIFADFNDDKCTQKATCCSSNLKGTGSCGASGVFPQGYRLYFAKGFLGGHSTGQGCAPWTHHRCGTAASNNKHKIAAMCCKKSA